MVTKVVTQQSFGFHTSTDSFSKFRQRFIKYLVLDTIDEASALTLDVPVNEFDGKVVYGEKNMKSKLKLTGHFNELEPKLKMLRQAEKLSQTQFIMLSQRQAGLVQHW